jgi:hypothetical protein
MASPFTDGERTAMLYEMRTYDLKPRCVAEVERRFGEAYEKRRKYSELAAFWHTEIGPLNQIIQVWGYSDLAERARIREAAVSDGAWPPKIAEFVMRQRSDIMLPFSFSPALKPGTMGPYFEIRTYAFEGGELPIIKKTWADVIEARVAFSPLCAAWYTEFGQTNNFVHIWPYASLDARAAIRKKAEATDMWPAGKKAERDGGRDYRVVSQENKIVVPSAFSPLQ